MFFLSKTKNSSLSTT